MYLIYNKTKLQLKLFFRGNLKKTLHLTAFGLSENPNAKMIG